VRDRLARATPSYLSRVPAHRGEDLQRRLVAVTPWGAWLAPDFLAALRAEVPVYRDQPWHQALADAGRLGDELPAARVVGPHIGPFAWHDLVVRADPEAVTFADRRLERALQRRVLGYEEVAAAGAS
jgi:hypothetical protein